MMRRVLRQAFLVLGLVCLAGTTSLAATMMHMNLDDMNQNAGKIFRGTVLEITSGEVELGGSMMPITTYILEVNEAFKGEFESVKGIQLAEVRMIGKTRPVTVGTAQRFSAIPDMPQLRMGETYLLFSTQPSSAGLSTTVGLGQGCFHLSGAHLKEMVVNEFDNLGLFSGTGITDIPVSGPVSYQRMATEIRTSLAAGKGGN
jgi:hypothetical protein